ncbi:hypothetical protein CKK34_6014 [Yarrowia sp. E02]|nr:hypothetical protein CKK34_6014 [Yarrowia sp. E02]
MDTTGEKKTISAEKLDQLKKEWSSISAGCVDILNGDSDRYVSALNDLLHELTPEIPETASKAECLEAQAKLLSVYPETHEFIRFTKDNLVANMYHRYEEVRDKAKQVREDTRVYGSNREVERLIDAMDEYMESLLDKQNDIVKIWNNICNTYVQSALYTLWQNQDEDRQDCLEWEYFGSFRKHVVKVKNTNLGVELAPDVARAPSRRDIPSEILALIFSFAEVETALALREVNTQCYSMFQSLDTLLESKMKKRNPWIRPGDGDLKSWQDVALVFAKRLESPKWVGTDDIDNAEVTGTLISKRTVVARELFFGHKLHPLFDCINDGSDCGTEVCEHIHFSASGDRLSMNPWTLESRREQRCHKVMGFSGQKSIVLKLDGVTMTLPTSLFTLGEAEDIIVDRSTVCVLTRSLGCLIMPRSNPHVDFGLVVDSVPHSAGDLTVLTQMEGFCSLGGYCLADFANQQLVKYTDSYKAPPAALYNGTVWLLRDERCMIPTFMDLKTPKKLYYRPDKAIKGMNLSMQPSQGSQARGSAQFVVGLTDSGMDVVDLAGGSDTAVTHQFGSKKTG